MTTRPKLDTPFTIFEYPGKRTVRFGCKVLDDGGDPPQLRVIQHFPDCSRAGHDISGWSSETYPTLSTWEFIYEVPQGLFIFGYHIEARNSAGTTETSCRMLKTPAEDGWFFPARWLILSEQGHCVDGYYFWRCTTDVDIHLSVWVSGRRPGYFKREHHKAGIVMIHDQDVIFTPSHSVPQLELGDTTTHSFLLPFPATLHRYYWIAVGTLRGDPAPSCSPVFHAFCPECPLPDIYPLVYGGSWCSRRGNEFDPIWLAEEAQSATENQPNVLVLYHHYCLSPTHNIFELTRGFLSFDTTAMPPGIPVAGAIRLVPYGAPAGLSSGVLALTTLTPGVPHHPPQKSDYSYRNTDLIISSAYIPRRPPEEPFLMPIFPEGLGCFNPGGITSFGLRWLDELLGLDRHLEPGEGYYEQIFVWTSGPQQAQLLIHQE